MNRRQFLGTAASLCALLGLPGRARAASRRKLLILWNAGGWDPTFVFDGHLEDGIGPTGATLGTAGGLSFVQSDSRPSVSELFTRYGDRAVIVNGISVGSISHDGCTRLMLTGGRSDAAADLPTTLASAAASALPLPHVVLSGPRFPGSLGSVLVPLSPLLTGTLAGELPESGTRWSADSESQIREYLAAEAGSGPRAQSWRDGLDRVAALEGQLDALAIPDNPSAEDLLDLSIDVLASGLCQSVLVGGTLPNQTTWDSHYNNATLQDRAFEHIFGRLLDLLDAMQDTAGESGGSLLDETTVMLLSEMGRNPSLNAADGKDHWPVTSALLLGAGVSGGRVLGATDEGLSALPVNFETGLADEAGQRLRPESLIAGVLDSFGVDAAAWLPGVEVFGAPFVSG